MMPPSIFRRARVDRDRMALGRIADLLHALVEQQLQHRAAVVAACRGSGSCRRPRPSIASAIRCWLRSRRRPRPASRRGRVSRRRRRASASPRGTCRRRSRGRPPRPRRRSRRRALRRSGRARSASPARRRGRTNWCGRGSACRRARAGSARPARRSSPSIVLRLVDHVAASASSVCPPVTRSRSSKNSSSG